MKPLYIKKNGVINKVGGIAMPPTYPSEDVTYDNTSSGLTGDTVQEAIDELAQGQSGGVQSDWNEADDTQLDYIKNKPTLGTASSKDVPTSGDAGNTEVVLGSDSRLSDARTPTSHTHTTSDISDFPTMSDYIEKSNTAGLVKNDGTIDTNTYAQTSSLGTAAAKNVPTSGDASTTEVVMGNDSRLTDARTPVSHTHTTSQITDFPTMTDYIQKSNTSGLVKNDGSIDTNTYATTTDISGKADKSEMSVTDGTGSDADKTTIQLKSGTSATVLKTHQDISGKVDKVDGKGLSTNDYTTEEKTKLSGIETGAQVNTITGVKGNSETNYRTGNVNITPANIGLGNVNNTSDATKKTNFTGSIADGNTGFTTGGDVYTALQGKVNTETGKGLSTNDYTTAEKTKLSGISANANKTEASTTNGNIKIDGTETPVYRNYGNNTVLSTDRTPYLNRPCLTPTGFSSYVREKLIGCSVAWNQLTDNDFTNNYTKTSCTLSKSGDVYTLTKTGSQGLMYKKESNVIVPIGHKILIIVGGLTSDAASVYVSLVRSNNNTTDVAISTSTKCVIHNVSGYDVYGFGMYLSTAVTSASFKNIQCIDLTLAFGSTVADTLYAMANNGGIDWLRNHNYPIDQYTQYGYYLVSSKPSAKKVVGKNLIPYPYNATTTTVQNIKFTDVGDGTFTASGTARWNPTAAGRSVFWSTRAQSSSTLSSSTMASTP